VQKSRPWVDFPRAQGPFYTITKITRNNELIYNGKSCGPGPRVMDRGRVTQSTMDRRWCGPKGTGVRWCAHWSLAFGHSRTWERTSGGTTGRGEHGDPGSGLTRAQAVVERRRDRGDERWWLELDVSAKEGVRELKRERKRGGEGRGCSSPFIGAEGASGRGGRGGNGQR
jgi:hypothetical protein